MSGIARLSNKNLNNLGFDPWGNREPIPNDFNAEIIEGNQYFPDGRIPSAKIKDLRVDTITITNAGYIRGGQTAYDTGTGFWMGYDSTDYKFSLGDSSGQKLTWDGTTLAITGTLTATTGSIGGFDIGTTYIRDAANSFGLASTVTGGDDVRFWAGATYTNRATAPFYVTEAGQVVAANITVTGGSISGVPISSIPNNSSTDISLLDMTHGLIFYVIDKATVGWVGATITMSNGRTFTISTGNTGTMTARTYIYLDTAVSSTVLQTTTTVSTAMGSNKKLIAVAQNGFAQSNFQVFDGIGGLKLGAYNTSISNNNWAFSGTWTVTSATVISWGSGTLTTSDGGSYSITGSNTGTMAAKTYIYFDLAVSSTAFQTTTTQSTAVGDGKILIAIAENGTGEATFLVVNDPQSNINASQIVAGSITANEIAAGSITSSLISVSQLSAISADMGAITAGTITLNSSGNIKSGQTAYDTGTGFWLGYVSSTTKFSLGNSAGNKLTWDGSTLSITGVLTATTGVIGGFDIGSDYIRDVANSFGLASTVTGGDDVRFWAGASFTNRATAPLRITEAGAITATSATISGALTTTSGSVLDGQYLTAGSVEATKVNNSIQSWSITCVFSASSSTVVAWAAGSLIMANGTTYSISAGNTGTMAAYTYIYLDVAVSTTVLQKTTTASTAVGSGKVLVAVAVNNTTEAIFQVFGGIGGSNLDGGSIVPSSITSTELGTGSVTSSKANISVQGWNITCAFSSSSATVVAWGAGTLRTADGTSYSIGASNTGTMAARTYIYFDVNVSTTALQITTTATTAVGDGKILIASAINNTTEATFFVFGGVGGTNLDGGSIVPSSVTTSEIADAAITATKTNITSQNWNLISTFSVNPNATPQQVDWGSGTLRFADGTVYSISAGNTGTMTGRTYIYFQPSVSTTALQVTTNSGTAIGDGKVLVATAIATATSVANYNVLGGIGGIKFGVGSLPISGQDWNCSCIFSASSSTQVDWASGFLLTSDFTTYSISAGNTGTMSSETYIYFDPAVSTTTFQTTTSLSTAFGNNKILIGKAKNNTNEAIFNIRSGRSANANIDGSNIVARSITASEIVAATITSNEIAANTIVAGNIVAGTITSTQIAAGTITATNIAAGTITATQIASGTITATQIAAATITGSLIAAGTITATNILSGTITATQIAAATITGSNIAANTISASNMNVATLSAISADMGSITAGTIVLPSGGYVRSGMTAYETGTGWYLGNDSGTPKFSIGVGGSNTSNLHWDGSELTVNGSVLAQEGFFGPGSSDMTISVNSVLVADLIVTNLTINTSIRLRTAGYRVFVKNKLTVNGELSNNGVDGGNATVSDYGDGASARANGTIGGGAPGGGKAGTGSGGANGGDISSNSIGGSGGNGGTGVTDSPGTGGTATLVTASVGSLYNAWTIISMWAVSINSSLPPVGTLQCFAGGAGGGRGAADNTLGTYGGGGGGGGGLMVVAAKIIENNGVMSVKGGAGGNAYQVSGNAGGGGGGGGGGFGFVYSKYSGSGSGTSAGGAGGLGHGTGTNGSTGSTGYEISLKI